MVLKRTISNIIDMCRRDVIFSSETGDHVEVTVHEKCMAMK